MSSGESRGTSSGNYENITRAHVFRHQAGKSQNFIERSTLCTKGFYCAYFLKATVVGFGVNAKVTINYCTKL